MVDELIQLEKKAGEQGWGGEFRKDLFDVIVEYLTIKRLKGRRLSIGGLLCHLIVTSQKWFSDVKHEKKAVTGVLIKGMDLPENCFKCPAHEWFDFGGENHGYQCPILRTTKCISNCEARTKRRDNCPMIPVRLHGRLGDLDALNKEIDRICDKYDAAIISEIACLNLILAAFKNAPTVTLAEED